MSDPRDDGQHPDGQHPDAPETPGAPEVGNVGEEAAKLFGALSEWARDSGGDLGSSLGGLAGHAAGAMAQANEHLATGAAECTYCPLCRTVHVVRSASPEVKAHLATAASSFLQAVAGVLATLPPTGPTGAAGGNEFEKIDLDGDDE